MSEIEDLKTIGTTAIHRLRNETLSLGQPFMINIIGLPSNHCYLEFPDQTIQLVFFMSEINDFVLVRKLTAKDCERLRKRLNLPYISLS